MPKVTDTIQDTKNLDPVRKMLNDIDAAYDLDDNPTREKDVERNLAKGRVLNDQYLGRTADTMGDIARRMADRRVDNRSIIARSRNSIMQFPVYISQTIPVNPANVIARLFDRVYASFVQSALAMHPVINEDEANNLLFMKSFHTNITEAAKAVVNEYYRPIDDMDAMLQESIFYQKEVLPGVVLECAWVPKSEEQLIQESARCVNDPLSGFTYLMEAGSITKTVEDQNLTDSELKNLARQYGNLPANASNEQIDRVIDQFKKDKKLYDKYKNARAGKGGGLGELDDDSPAMKRIEKIVNSGKEDMYNRYKLVDGQLRKTRSTISNRVDNGYDRAVDAPVLLRDGDVKRINSMVPWTIQASFHVKDSKGNPGYDVKFLIGVKSVLHPIDPNDLSNELRELIMGNEKSLQKVRYKTGEISFMNYLFNIPGLKRDASNHINYNKRWLNTLKRLSDSQKRHGGMRLLKTSDANIPNGTLVLTHQDVINMTNKTGIDLSSAVNAKKLARSLFLICVGILDSTAGSFRVLFPDRDDDWDVQSIASIDAEVTKTDNSKLMNELNRLVNR